MCMMTFDRPIAVAYMRVSTDRQGRSGLGLDAQKAAVRDFCEKRGLTLDSSFVEVETGKRNDRPDLAKAIARARRLRGVLVIAKLDRLARKVAFIANLMEQGAAFACVDAPDDDAFMLHIRAAVAEDEAKKISARTKAALAQVKERGVKLGNPQNLTMDGRARGARNGAMTMKQRGQENHNAIRDAIFAARERGLSLRMIAAEVDSSAMTVLRILKLEGKA